MRTAVIATPRRFAWEEDGRPISYTAALLTGVCGVVTREERGVPLFFGWLRRKYPGIVAEIVDLLAEDGVHCAGSAQVRQSILVCAVASR